jgi:hypothetical protein
MGGFKRTKMDDGNFNFISSGLVWFVEIRKIIEKRK